MRATLAVIQNDAETIIAQSLRAKEYLHPDNLLFRNNCYLDVGACAPYEGEIVRRPVGLMPKQ